MHMSRLLVQPSVFLCYAKPASSLVQLKFFYSSVTVCAKKKARVPVPGAYTPPDPEERLKHLKSGEKTVAVLAGISLLVGYCALKYMSSKAANAKRLQLLQPELPVLVVAGPSGSGKSTLIRKLFSDYPNKFAFSVSHTTRKPRSGETDGKEYHFTAREDMQKSIDDGNFIEWAEYSGNLYGTSVKSVMQCQKQGKVCVLDIDMQGVQSIKESELNEVVLYVHVKPPSLQVLEERLRARKTDTEDAVMKRLDVAKKELEYAATPGVFDHVVVNDDVEQAYKALEAVINEKMKVKDKSE